MACWWRSGSRRPCGSCVSGRCRAGVPSRNASSPSIFSLGNRAGFADIGRFEPCPVAFLLPPPSRSAHVRSPHLPSRCHRSRTTAGAPGRGPRSLDGRRARRCARRSPARSSPGAADHRRPRPRPRSAARTQPSSPGATCPAPRRGELVRLFGEELRAAKADLGRLVTLEAGKIASEGLGRSAGDDRHLRLRRRPVAPALRPDASPPSAPSTG